MIPETGPFLKAAAICSDVIEGKDGVLSLIRVIDRAIITAAGPEAPQVMPSVPQSFKIVVMFISGRAKGTHPVAIKLEKPDATVADLWNGTVFFEGEDRGANIVIALQQEFDQEGLYWFKLLLEDNQLTKLPFRLIYERVGSG